MRRALPLVLLALAACAGAADSSGVEVRVGTTDGGSRDVVTDAGQPMPASDGSTPTVGTSQPDDPGSLVTAADGRPVLPDTVAVVGDSLTLSAQAEIETALTDLGLEVVGFDAVESRRMVRSGPGSPPGVDAVADILDVVDPELWVIALGTNDVGAEVSEEMFVADMGEILSLVPRGVPVLWVDTFIRQRDDAVVDANSVIRSVVALRPGSHVVDWYTHGEEPGIVTIDGVHLTTRGQARFAESIAITIHEAFAPR